VTLAEIRCKQIRSGGNLMADTTGMSRPKDKQLAAHLAATRTPALGLAKKGRQQVGEHSELLNLGQVRVSVEGPPDKPDKDEEDYGDTDDDADVEEGDEDEE